jgi:hypothetical protein
MIKAAVQKHVSDKLVRLKINGVYIMKCKKVFYNKGITVAKNLLRNKDQHVYNDQVFYYGGKPVRPVVVKITHCANLTVIVLCDDYK